ncbi:senescence-induced receptor-like serine/threonine-protein kinase [Eucalyptus grandis]|uniref:senescence-induced receptor-like serine/threonine-protein kinase n=1 Tax=Eucalyptus grandis TaxID=71139 RepID=UPI00192EE5F3|nr:senescence-induced receptor-like serine/threonine-protein kinase [Eucalyptus grandis]
MRRSHLPAIRCYNKTLRSFPNGTRNCYTLRPDNGKSNTYLIRATFLYGNYDRKNQIPTFDLYIDVNYWDTINTSNYVFTEVVYVPQRDYIQVCLVNIGKGVPFISALELRPLINSPYWNESGFLRLDNRFDIGGLSGNIRYPDDVYDRIWNNRTFRDWRKLNQGASASDLSNNYNSYKVPGDVLQTAQAPIVYSLISPNVTAKWIVYFHFAETQILPSGQQRSFTVSTGDGQFMQTVRLEYLKSVTVVSPPLSGSTISFLFKATTGQSGYPPPIINAMEIFQIQELPNVPTAQDDGNLSRFYFCLRCMRIVGHDVIKLQFRGKDKPSVLWSFRVHVKALTATKAEYDVKKDSWQGDPCVPSKFAWKDLNCNDGDPPRVISLNLSSSNLRGNIHSSLSNLSELESLDLSNNELTGAIPETLANLPKLRILNLSGNKLNGSVPEALKRMVKDNGLDLRFDNNPDLCSASPCPKKEAKTKNSILVPVVASVSGVVVIICLVVIWLIRRKQIRGMVKLRSFNYGEITRITKNFGTEIGEGGYGKVYLGTLENGTKVAVKMLSKKSWQGDKEFQAEEKHLMIVHHGNLVSLHGYCDHSENKALVYEYMANGNLQQHLHGDKPVLTWKQRLHIIVDVAKGLEYLHNGCDPPIIHRDLKATNILLNEKMQAKISDFGLSRTITAETDAHVSTRAVGTPGYLDPEYHSTISLNKKSDVFSLGIILLELITGHPAMMMKPEGNVHILNWANSLIESKNLQKIMDPKLKGEFDSKSTWKAIRVAESCTKPTGDQRPDLDHVLAELKDCLKTALEPEKSPEDGKQNEKIK